MVIAIRQEKKMEGKQIRKEEVKVSLSADDDSICKRYKQANKQTNKQTHSSKWQDTKLT